MGQFGTCGHCKNEWYTACTTGKIRLPRHIPTCPEGSIMAVCNDCFDKLPSAEIVRIAIEAYRASCTPTQPEPGVTQVLMSPTEHLLVESAIKGWVSHMKGESKETPFEQTTLSL